MKFYNYFSDKGTYNKVIYDSELHLNIGEENKTYINAFNISMYKEIREIYWNFLQLLK